MNVADFLNILQKSNTILSPQQTRELEDIVNEYPYFQASRALYLKGLKNLDSYKYNDVLKVTAAYTSDREVLFDYITSQHFVQNHIADTLSGRSQKLEEQDIVSEAVEPNPETEVMLGEPEEAPYPQNIDHAEQILDPQLFASKEPKPAEESTQDVASSTEQESQDDEPLPKTSGFEKHSFSEWLALTSTSKTVEIAPEKQELVKKRKFELLDKFIEENPKIVPKDKTETKIDIKYSVKMDKSELMTETLSKVYLEQKKYKKAIQAFKILSLKYPEKSSFFADQIQAVKKLQKNKDK
ncbi:MAG: hypothetical protein AAF554_03875 [Bacteroidota bacterium]